MPAGRYSVALAASAVVLALRGLTQAARAREAWSLQDLLASRTERPILDQDGQKLVVDPTADRVVALTFFETECSIQCVSRLLDLGAVLKALPAEDRSRVTAIALTADPDRDRPGVLKSFATGVRLDTSAVLLAASTAQATTAMLSTLGWQPQPDSVDRVPATVFVFDRRGAFAMRYGGQPLDRQRLARDLSTLARLDRGVGQDVARVPFLH